MNALETAIKEFFEELTKLAHNANAVLESEMQKEGINADDSSDDNPMRGVRPNAPRVRRRA